MNENSQPETSLDLNTAVEIDCQRDALPIHISPGDTAHMVILNSKVDREWGTFDSHNNSVTEQTWPRKELLSSTTNPSIYRCEVTNQGNTKLIDVGLKFNINYMFGDKNKAAQIHPYTVIVNPLEVGKPFKFYFVNECPVGASVILLDQYTTRVLGEPGRRSFSVTRPHRKPVEQIMLFFPSSVRWTGQACE